MMQKTHVRRMRGRGGWGAAIGGFLKSGLKMMARPALEATIGYAIPTALDAIKGKLSEFSFLALSKSKPYNMSCHISLLLIYERV
jgi:hypothetical protein